jgi:hypothetical protein
MGGLQLKWPGTPQLCQHGAGDLLPVVVPQHVSHARMMRGCMLVDPLGSQAVRRLGLHSRYRGKNVLGKFSI